MESDEIDLLFQVIKSNINSLTSICNPKNDVCVCAVIIVITLNLQLTRMIEFCYKMWFSRPGSVSLVS